MTFGPGDPYDQRNDPAYFGGAQFGHSQQPHGQASPLYVQQFSQAPNDYLVWAILTTIFCCLPLGIVSIVKAKSVSKRWAVGDQEGAFIAAAEAKRFALWSAISSVAVALITMAVTAALGFGYFFTSPAAPLTYDQPPATYSTYNSYEPAAPSESPDQPIPLPSPTQDIPGADGICVLNAGTETGLTTKYVNLLRDGGYETTETGNLATASITENTVFYDVGLQVHNAARMAVIVGGQLVERPDTFTKCPRMITVVVVN